MAEDKSPIECDLVVIGAGPGGYVCAIRAAQLGLSVVCVEAEKTLGGTCLNVGCIPSKALLESSHHYHAASHEYQEHGIDISSVSLNLAKMLSRKEQVVDGITKGIDFLFKKNKITRVLGRAKIRNDKKVLVTNADTSQEISAKHIVLATGSLPIDLPIAKQDGKRIVNSTGGLSFTEVPKKLLVLGGGYIGVELGSVWARLGAEVEVIELLPNILGPMDSSLTQNMLRILEKTGLKFHLETKLLSAKVEGEKVHVHCEKKGEQLELTGDRLLVTVGRRPNSENLGLDELGIKRDKVGRIEVNEKFETSCTDVYAIGDVIKGPMLAHKAEEEGVALAELLSGKAGHVNYSVIPSVVYTWPEIASVGLTEAECQAKNLKVKIGQFSFKANGRAKAIAQTDGFVKIIADQKTDRVYGVHILGATASEMIAEACLAMEYGASSEDIARTMHAHPTLSEAVKEAALACDKRALHS